MPLVKLQDGTSQWPDIKNAAQILQLTSVSPDTNTLRNQIAAHCVDTPLLLVTELHTGINVGRSAVLVLRGETVTIAFQGSHQDELVKNAWVNAKGPNWWDIPYPVYTGGHRVHSFFRDMWHGMRTALFSALAEAIQSISQRHSVPKLITVTGFSMGGGVSM
jgi:hypothetical protein